MDGPSTSYDSGQGGHGGQDADPLSEMARMVVDGVTAFLSSVVGALSDWALSLLPQHVKRRAVENSVKGALALLGMALLQSVLALVLTVGTVVLVVYAAHQVFGVQLPFLPGGPQGPDRGPGGPQGAGQGGGGAGPADPRFYSAGAAQPYADYGPYQPGYDRYYTGYGGRGQPYTRPGAGGGGRGQGPKGPVIDVYYESP